MVEIAAAGSGFSGDILLGSFAAFPSKALLSEDRAVNIANVFPVDTMLKDQTDEQLDMQLAERLASASTGTPSEALDAVHEDGLDDGMQVETSRSSSCTAQSPTMTASLNPSVHSDTSGLPTQVPVLSESAASPVASLDMHTLERVRDQQVPAKQFSAEDSKGPKRKGAQVHFNAVYSDYDVVVEVAEGHGWKVVKSEEKAVQCNVHWIDKGVINDWLPRVEPWMRVNHFPGMNNALARKTRLARNMCRMMRIFPKEYSFIPATWILPDDLGDLEKRFGEGGESKAIYIVKPDHLCQGRGIFLTTELERLKKASDEGRQKDQAVVVQRYISRPMLIEGLKFDLRLYFLVGAVLTEGGGLEPRCYLFRDGLVRLCTTAYEAPTPETLGNKKMHLTNYAINKNSKNFQQPEGDDDSAGSKRSLRWFLNFVEEQYGEKERQKLWRKLGSLCVKMLLTVTPTLEAEYFSTFPKDLTGGQFGCRCFEILGVDVMLDQKRKPYLIEVNHLPSFTCDSPLDQDIKERVLNQVLDLTCNSLTGKEKKNYDSFVRERREAAAFATAATASTGTPTRSGCGRPSSVGGRARSSSVKAGSCDAGRDVDVQPPAVEPPSAKVCPEVEPNMLELPQYKDFERVYPPLSVDSPKLAEQYDTILSRVRQAFRPVMTTQRRRSPENAEPEPPQPVKGARPPMLPSKDGQKREPSSAISRCLSGKRSQSALPRLARLASPRCAPRSRSPGPGNAVEYHGTPRGAMVRQRSLPPRVCVPLKDRKSVV